MNNTTDTFSTLDEIVNSHTRAYIPAIVYLTFVIFTGFVSNSFAFLFYAWKADKSVIQYFISVLSLNDALTNMVMIHDVVELFYFVEYRSLAVCKLFYFLKHFLVGNSLMLIVVLALDRYRLVCHPFKKQLTKRRAKYIVFGLLLFSFTISVHYFATSDVVTLNFVTDTGFAVDGYYCTLSKGPPFSSIRDVFHTTDMYIYVLGIGCMTVVYILIIKKIVHTKQKLKSHIKLTSPTIKTANDNMGQTDTAVSIFNIKVNNDINECSIHSNRDTQQTPHTEDDPHDFCNLKDSESTKKRTKGMLSVFDLIGIELKMLVMAFVITVASVVCFVPYYVSMMMSEANMDGTGLLFTVGEIIARRSYILNSVVNPLILMYYTASFRQYVFNALCSGYCRVKWFKCNKHRSNLEVTNKF